MNVAPIIFFEMLVSILVLAGALVVTAYCLLRITKNLHDNLNKKDESGTKAIKIIDEANNQALDIISKAALSTDTASENFKENLLRVSSAQIEEFEKASSDFIKLYFQTLQDLKTKNIEVFQDVSKGIEVNATEEIKNFKNSMQKLTAASQDEVKKKIAADYSACKKGIENYKKEELQKIDSGIYELLEKVAKLILGKALSLSEHENLIENSLEKAKKEGMFE